MTSATHVIFSDKCSVKIERPTREYVLNGTRKRILSRTRSWKFCVPLAFRHAAFNFATHLRSNNAFPVRLLLSSTLLCSTLHVGLYVAKIGVDVIIIGVAQQ